jgi:hypothetical protein
MSFIGREILRNSKVRKGKIPECNSATKSVTLAALLGQIRIHMERESRDTQREGAEHPGLNLPTPLYPLYAVR